MKRRKKRHFKKSFKLSLVIIILFLLLSCIYYKQKETLVNGNTLIENNDSFNINTDIDLNENLTTLEKLQVLSKYDNRINTIINNYDDYPEPLIEMLTRNLDMLDFVLEYPQKLGNIYSDNVGNVKKGTIPLLLQWDTRWGYAKYGDSSIAISGCGPTALSMVIVGLTGDNTMTPYKIAKFSEDNGYFFSNSGTSWSLMTEGARKLGLKSKEISLSKNLIFNALENGHPIICSMGAGDFTTTGHFIVLTGIENGKIKINDSNSKERSNQLWEYERLQSQIKNLWEYSK